VTSEDDVQKVLDYIVDKEGRIDVVVNNAGISAPGPIVEQSLDTVKQVFDTNTFSILRLCKAVVPTMAKQNAGTIVNIGSIMGEISSPWSGVYCASKAATNSISEVLSMELRPFGISVLHVAPGGVKSNIAVNGVNRLTLPENTLYARYLHNIFDRINASQDSWSMDNDEFAKKVVTNALKDSPPRYMTLGGRSTLFSFLKWLPRRLVLYFMWRRFSGPASA